MEARVKGLISPEAKPVAERLLISRAGYRGNKGVATTFSSIDAGGRGSLRDTPVKIVPCQRNQYFQERWSCINGKVANQRKGQRRCPDGAAAYVQLCHRSHALPQVDPLSAYRDPLTVHGAQWSSAWES